MPNRYRERILWVFIALLIASVLGLVAITVLVSLSPVSGTRGADLLRRSFGPKAVAKLESIVFTIQDAANRAVYMVKPDEPGDPWKLPADPANSVAMVTVPPVVNSSPAPPTAAGTAQSPPGAVYQTPAINLETITTPTGDQSVDGLPHPTTTPDFPALQSVQSTWVPGNITPMGGNPDEGIWTAYILDQSNVPLAYRTFLQPDPERPYVVVGIVAIDLARVQLHYQLGTHEPESPASGSRTGQIPAMEMQPGILLAAFNGGFKSINGHFGVYVDGETLLPPIEKMGTVAIFEDGSVRIGEWGNDLTLTPDLIVFRQNCPLLVHDGEVNPLVYNNSINDWGGTVSGNIVTFRSGVGISQNGNTLYYFAGNSLNMPSLAEAMQKTGAYNAMQLDINNFYVLFTRFIYQDGQWAAEPLLPKQMVDKLDRFLGAYSHDFFYLTEKTP